jgi:hypothetical protein
MGGHSETTLSHANPGSRIGAVIAADRQDFHTGEAGSLRSISKRACYDQVSIVCRAIDVLPPHSGQLGP